jgi:hypothetical protein
MELNALLTKTLFSEISAGFIQHNDLVLVETRKTHITRVGFSRPGPGCQDNVSSRCSFPASSQPVKSWNKRNGMDTWNRMTNFRSRNAGIYTMEKIDVWLRTRSAGGANAG